MKFDELIENREGSAPAARSTENLIRREIIEAQLARILSSREFARSYRMVRFLRYVVQSRMDGRSEQAKERFIGIEVFDRPKDWDPKIDTIVRTEARRLRSKLEQYYSTSSGDPVRFTLPKGSYYPDFTFLQDPASLAKCDAAASPREPHSKLADAPMEQAKTARRTPLSVLLSVGLIGAAAIVSWLAFLRPPARERTSAFEVVPFANEIGTELSPAISPDGKSIAYAWDGNDGNYDIYIKRADGGPNTRPRRITESAKAELDPSWSPNGRTLAYLQLDGRSSSLVLMDLISGKERHLVTLKQIATGWASENSPFVDIGPSWMPDGKSIIFSDLTESADHNDNQTDALYRIDVANRALTPIVETPRGMKNFFPRVSPDGRRLAFARYVSHGVSDLYLCNIDGSGLRPLTAERRAITGLAWSSGSDAVYYTSWHHGSSRIWRIGISPGSRDEPLPDAMSAAELSVSRGDEWIAYTSVIENWNIWRIPLNETDRGITLGAPQRFIASSGRNHGPSFSPDGKKLAFISDRSGSWQIWLANSDGSNVRQISRSDGSFLGFINWTPDSKRIVFDARPAGNSNIYMLDVPAGGVPKPLNRNRFEERMPSFSADGKSIYFNSDRDGVVAVWKTDLKSRLAKKIGIEGSFKCLEAPSGKRLFYNVFESLYSANPDGSQVSRLPIDPSPELNWAPTDRALYYSEQKDNGEIAFMSYRNGRTMLLEKIPGELVQNTSNLTVSPDRHWLLYAQRDQSTRDIVIRRKR